MSLLIINEASLRSFLLTTLVLAAPAPLLAQKAAIPSVLIQGFELLKRDSVAATTAIWARSWTGPADSGKAEVVSEGMRQLRDFAGAFMGHDVARMDTVTPNLLRIYVVLRYERQPIYAHFVMYNPASAQDAWTVVTVTWNTDPKLAWPANLWTP